MTKGKTLGRAFFKEGPVEYLILRGQVIILMCGVRDNMGVKIHTQMNNQNASSR